MSKSRTADIRHILLGGPSTSYELCASLGMTPRNVNVGLWILRHGGQVKSEVKVEHRNWKRGKRRLKLFELTYLGRMMALEALGDKRK